MLNKVLFIDDDRVASLINRRLMGKVLPEAEIVQASNGKEAIAYYVNLLECIDENVSYPELVFLDLHMPVMDGWGFLNEFSKPQFQPFNNTKIVLLSSSVSPLDLERSRGFPIVIDFVAKPVSVELLRMYQADL
ncbi:response regulator [Pedobacter sp. P351]|uniref:response regulator n=1 Tax=Pedobacter superstes TaxID=3133441 RepID=UPI0030A19BAD